MKASPNLDGEAQRLVCSLGDKNGALAMKRAAFTRMTL
jgi:hypothetical protein